MDKKIEADAISDPENELLFNLVAYIKENNLTSGSKLPPIRALAKQWDVSPSIVRSVLIKASMVGFVEMVQGAGCYVRSVDIASMTVMFSLLFKTTMVLNNSQFIHLYEIKAAIDAGMFRTAAQTRTTEELYNLKNILVEMKKLENSDDYKKMISLDDDFHIAIARMTRNPLYETFEATLQILLLEDRLNKGPSKGYVKRHAEVFEAIREGDQDLAEELGKTHSNPRRRLLSLEGVIDN